LDKLNRNGRNYRYKPQVSIRKLKEIHTATHPAKMKRTP
jgi:hypothetical protein